VRLLVTDTRCWLCTPTKHGPCTLFRRSLFSTCNRRTQSTDPTWETGREMGEGGERKHRDQVKTQATPCGALASRLHTKNIGIKNIHLTHASHTYGVSLLVLLSFCRSLPPTQPHPHPHTHLGSGTLINRQGGPLIVRHHTLGHVNTCALLHHQHAVVAVFEYGTRLCSSIPRCQFRKIGRGRRRGRGRFRGKREGEGSGVETGRGQGGVET